MPKAIDLSNFAVNKFYNADAERNYINDILHAIVARIAGFESNSGIGDAPSDGTTYGRRNGAWTAVSSGGGSGGAGVVSLNALSGALTLTSTDSSVVITPAGSTIDLSASPLHHKRNTLTAVGGETLIFLQQNVYEDAWDVYKQGLNLNDSQASLTAANRITLATGATTSDKIIVEYWSRAAITAVSAFGMSILGTYPAAFVGIPYTQDLSIVGGAAPYSLTGGTGLISGSLPPGLSLSIVGSNFRLSGTPTTNGSYSFVVGADDSSFQSAVSTAQGITVTTAVLWDPTKLGTGLVLSAGNTIATLPTATGDYRTVVASTPASTGKRCFQLTLNSPASVPNITFGVTEQNGGGATAPVLWSTASGFDMVGFFNDGSLDRAVSYNGARPDISNQSSYYDSSPPSTTNGVIHTSQTFFDGDVAVVAVDASSVGGNVTTAVYRLSGGVLTFVKQLNVLPNGTIVYPAASIKVGGGSAVISGVVSVKPTGYIDWA